MKIEELKEQAARCRRLAEQADPITRQRLLDLAEEYDAKNQGGRTDALTGLAESPRRRLGTGLPVLLDRFGLIGTGSVARWRINDLT